MKVFVAFCVLLIDVYCISTTIDEQYNDQWELFKRTYNREFSSVAEEATRRTIWETNLAKIRKHNLEADIGLHSYTLGMNRFGDMTNEEFRKQMNGLQISIENDHSDYDHHTFRAPAHVTIPDEVDWRKEGYVTSVKDQGQCGSCWAFSATGSLEGQHYAQTKQLVSLSEQNLIDCSGKFGNMGCDGGLMDSSFQYIKANGGIDNEASYPYEAVDGKCRFKKENIGATDSGYADIKKANETDLEIAIATIGPISVAIDASQSSFQLYKSGIYDEPACSTTALDHGVLAVGYGKKGEREYYIIKNSWDTSWGEQGYILMSRKKRNQCGIATMASYPLV